MARLAALNLLVGYVPSPAGGAAIELAASLAGSVERARVTVASVLATDPLSVATVGREFAGPLAEEIESQLRPVAGRFPDGVAVDTRVVAAGSPAGGLDEIARSVAAEVLVLGETHRSRRVDPARDTASRLLARAPCPVAIAPAGYAPRRPLRTVGIAFDGSPESARALGLAQRLAPAEAELVLLAVVDLPRLRDFGRRMAMSTE